MENNHLYSEKFNIPSSFIGNMWSNFCFYYNLLNFLKNYKNIHTQKIVVIYLMSNKKV